MDERFTDLFNLSEGQAIALLDTPLDQDPAGDIRYTAAAHLSTCSSVASINALLRAVSQRDPRLCNRIVRRKAIESLGRLQATEALSAIHQCLSDPDPYTIENAVWSIGEIGTDAPEMGAAITALLSQPGQSYRVILHTLSKLDYTLSLPAIEPFTHNPDPLIASAAIAAVSRLGGSTDRLSTIVGLLQHPNVLARRLCIQDLIDLQYTAAIPEIARSPISLIFRLRGIRQLASAGIAAGTLTFEQIQPPLEQVLRDHPRDLNLIHTYDTPPGLPRLIRDLYDTDFGRCYRASHTLLSAHTATAPAALLATYAAEAHSDYGAHYHVIKLLGWLRHRPAFDLLLDALHNRAPQFQKSRIAAAIALGELGDSQAIPALATCLESPIWDLKYAALLALAHLGAPHYDQVSGSDDWLVQAQAAAAQSPQPLSNH